MGMFCATHTHAHTHTHTHTHTTLQNPDAFVKELKGMFDALEPDYISQNTAVVFQDMIEKLRQHSVSPPPLSLTRAHTHAHKPSVYIIIRCVCVCVCVCGCVRKRVFRDAPDHD